MTFKITDVHHIELTVTDLQKSKQFYMQLPGFKIVAEYSDFIMFHIETFYLGFTTHKEKHKETVFDEYNTGLDHIAFEVSKREDLDNACKFFDEKNISHGAVEKLSNGSFVLTFRDPDNIQLELCYKSK
jgi:glyoxylase I family protein